MVDFAQEASGAPFASRAQRTQRKVTVTDKATPAGATGEPKVRFVEATEEESGQRIDNWLVRTLKGVPKSHLWRIIREGQVRVNRKKVEASYKLAAGDVVRIPPVRTASRPARPAPAAIPAGAIPVLYEDRDIVVLDKPAHMAVHGGSGVSFGLIERLRATRPEAALELVHRLDKETSGVIVVAKTRKALVRLHEAIREGQVRKTYAALLLGDFEPSVRHVKLALKKYLTREGERRVRVDDEGLASHSVFRKVQAFGRATLVDVELLTGRTHQIRVHAASIGHPIAGDDKYGDFAMNDAIAKGAFGAPFKRMFLHARRIAFTHPVTREELTIEAPLPIECAQLIQALKAHDPQI